MVIIYHKFIEDTQESIFDRVLGSILVSDNVFLASPYFDVNYATSYLGSNWRWVTDIRALFGSTPVTRRGELIDFLNSNAHRVRHCANLHAKVAIADAVAYVGSANFTKPGAFKNVELGLEIIESEQLAELKIWSEGLWRWSVNFDIANLASLSNDIPYAPRDNHEGGRWFSGPTLNVKPATKPAYDLNFHLNKVATQLKDTLRDSLLIIDGLDLDNARYLHDYVAFSTREHWLTWLYLNTRASFLRFDFPYHQDSTVKNAIVAAGIPIVDSWDGSLSQTQAAIGSSGYSLRVPKYAEVDVVALGAVLDASLASFTSAIRTK